MGNARETAAGGREPAAVGARETADDVREPSGAACEPSRKRRDVTDALVPDIQETTLNILGRSFTREQVLEMGFGAAALAVIGKLVSLQSCQSGYWMSKSATMKTAHMTLPSRRGTIFDRNGYVLAGTQDTVTIGIHPNAVRTYLNSKEARYTLASFVETLAADIGGSASQYLDVINRDTVYADLARQVDPAVKTRLKSHVHEKYPGRKPVVYEEDFAGLLEYFNSSKRVYPYENVGGQVVGSVNLYGEVLTAGVEHQYNDLLAGKDGELIEMRSMSGYPIASEPAKRTEPQDGQNIVLSIDVDIQRVAQEELERVVEESHATGAGCVVVMIPKTGEILALCSTPDFDPYRRTYSAGCEITDCLKHPFEPGSTFKPLTAAMAVDMGLANSETNFWVPAKYQVGADMVGDADDRSYDTDMSLRNILERSSNVGAVLCAELVGREAFSQYVQKFRLTETSGVDLPGEMLGTLEKLWDYTNSSWGTAAFGQGVSVAPVNMARAIGVIANEGLMVRPHVLVSVDGRNVEYPAPERVISTAAAEHVAWMMNSVIENGYGYSGRVEGYNLSGKTGTSERYDDTTGTYMYGRYTASFVGFGPTEDPQVLVYLLIDDVPSGSGSQTAGAPWASIMSYALYKLGIPPSY